MRILRIAFFAIKFQEPFTWLYVYVSPLLLFIKNWVINFFRIFLNVKTFKSQNLISTINHPHHSAHMKKITYCIIFFLKKFLFISQCISRFFQILFLRLIDRWQKKFSMLQKHKVCSYIWCLKQYFCRFKQKYWILFK